MARAPRLYEQRARIIAEPAERVARGLNEAQKSAATHEDGPLLIIAGAGTGKTRTLVHRVAHLIERGVAPERILLLTFTRRAAQEMLSRAEQLVGGTSRAVSGGTFHATGHRLLRKFGPAAALPSDFTIMDEGDAADLMQLSRSQLGYATTHKRFPKKETLHYVYSRFINTEIPVADIIRDELPQFTDYIEDFGKIFADYTRRKHERNLVDYDDLLLYWLTMLETGGPLAERISGLYDHLLVDEYQDTNLLQARILRAMCRTHANITVVGDDAQSIYSFRGANFRNILDFPTQFPGARMVTLEQNYRSTAPILDMTNALISRASERYTKELWTERSGGERPWLVSSRDETDQTRFVVDRILELYEEGTPLNEIAVLFRAGYMSAELEIELTNRKIPFEKWGGIKFLETAHVKDVLAFLRILENPRDEVSWYRILQLLPGIGEITARSVITALAEMAWQSEAFARFTPPPRARAAHEALVALLEDLRRRPGAESSGVGDDIARVRMLYDGILKERYDRPEPRLADLDQLQIIAAGYPSRDAFLSSLALEPPQATQDLVAGQARAEDDVLVLSTAHSAKGREWDAVFVIWSVDGWFPSGRALNDPESLEEERRLMYVALTRARNHLAVTHPLNAYGSRGGSDYFVAQLCRFFDAGVRQRMERVTPAASSSPEETDYHREALDVRALLRGRLGF